MGPFGDFLSSPLISKSLCNSRSGRLLLGTCFPCCFQLCCKHYSLDDLRMSKMIQKDEVVKGKRITFSIGFLILQIF
jgi:hypothetical protein